MIELLPFTRDDIPRLIGWVPSAEFLMQWAGWAFRFPLDAAQLERHLEGTRGPDPVRMVFKAIAAEGVIGHIELNHIDRANRSATISRVLVGDPALRGRGYGAAMVQRVLEIGFDELGLHRIDLYVFDFNHAAIACYTKLGFVIEGRLRDLRKMGDSYWSVYQMSMLEHEWAQRRRAAAANDVCIPANVRR
jgi:RimJ/RimL family protein N-acetyltransferase